MAQDMKRRHSIYRKTEKPGKRVSQRFPGDGVAEQAGGQSSDSQEPECPEKVPACRLLEENVCFRVPVQKRPRRRRSGRFPHRHRQPEARLPDRRDSQVGALHRLSFCVSVQAMRSLKKFLRSRLCFRFPDVIPVQAYRA